MSHSPQIRAARALLGWSAANLADKCGITTRTVQRLEACDSLGEQRASTYAKVRALLEAHGIEFIGDPEKSPGVILHRSHSEE